MAAVRRPTFGDMIRTVVIFAVIVIAVVVFLPRGKGSSDPVRVDYAGPLDLVRHRASFSVYQPEGLPESWIANAVRISVPQGDVTTTGFDVGFFDRAKDTYVRVQQSDDRGLIAAALGKKAAQTGTTQIAGATWQTWSDSDGAAALVRTPDSRSTIVISGKGDQGVLATEEQFLAEHLR